MSSDIRSDFPFLSSLLSLPSLFLRLSFRYPRSASTWLWSWQWPWTLILPPSFPISPELGLQACSASSVWRVLGNEARALCMLDKQSTTRAASQPSSQSSYQPRAALKSSITSTNHGIRTSMCSLVISQGLWANTLLSSPKFCSFWGAFSKPLSHLGSPPTWRKSLTCRFTR